MDARQRKMVEREIAATVEQHMPFGFDDEHQAEWRRVATMLADPKVQRLKAQYLDSIEEYVRVRVRIRRLREAIGPKVSGEIYNPGGGRNGLQLRSSPHVPQLNEALRQWRSLVAVLGLSPTDEKRMEPGDGGADDDDDEFED